MAGTNKTTENIIKLINAGGSIAFDASNKTTDNLIDIVAAAARAGVKVTLKNTDNKTTDNLLSIIAVGKDNVVIEL